MVGGDDYVPFVWHSDSPKGLIFITAGLRPAVMKIKPFGLLGDLFVGLRVLDSAYAEALTLRRTGGYLVRTWYGLGMDPVRRSVPLRRS
ncbi:MAG: hypothetical protein LBR10_08030 [Prevotellaceae bacterium]|nr:hypothetical protein [Prevotellaceae bacterium]